MSENPELRIGDAEREAALRDLGEHMSAGRLTVDEYGERSAHVATARTQGELTALFADLPQPRPRFGRPAPPPPTAYPHPHYPQHHYPPPHYPALPPRSPAQRMAQVLLPVAGVAIVLMMMFGFRFFSPFMFIPLVFLFAYSRRNRGWR
ncbi:DUF1707 SHOCT-like domain-containing protein [Actinokineospora sp. 24-640]